MRIAVIGLAGAGKDTLCDMLQTKLVQAGVDVTNLRFADPIKRGALFAMGESFDDRDTKEVERSIEPIDAFAGVMVCAGMLFDTPEQVAYARRCAHGVLSKYLHEDEYHISSRVYQQLLGTDIIRYVKDSAFVDAVYQKKIKGVGLIRDYRFANEGEGADHRVFVYNPNVQRVADHASERLAGNLQDRVRTVHKETGCVPKAMYTEFGVFHIVDNSGSLELLERRAVKLLASINRSQKGG